MNRMLKSMITLIASRAEGAVAAEAEKSALAVMPTDIWLKGYFVMGTTMLVQTSITMAKTVRDAHETAKLVNRIEDARTERLLMGMDAN
jgi:hypothetical protein